MNMDQNEIERIAEAIDPMDDPMDDIDDDSDSSVMKRLQWMLGRHNIGYVVKQDDEFDGDPYLEADGGRVIQIADGDGNPNVDRRAGGIWIYGNDDGSVSEHTINDEAGIIAAVMGQESAVLDPYDPNQQSRHLQLSGHTTPEAEARAVAKFRALIGPGEWTQRVNGVLKRFDNDGKQLYIVDPDLQ